MSGVVLITGGAGSVGRALTNRLRTDGWVVRVFDLPNCDFSGLEGVAGIEVWKGDITDTGDVQRAVQGIDALIHLAALLPPLSEQDRERTFAVNVQGTANLLEALEKTNPQGVFIFSSSVSTYGDTSQTPPPVTVDRPQQALDIYAESKIAAEQCLRNASLPTVILRIAPIAVPAFQEPPAIWPFQAEQRVEMVHRDDVVEALYQAVKVREAWGKILNIAGGKSWQKRGRDYVHDLYQLIGVPLEEARFRQDPGWVDWYDTTESQHLLHYQRTSYAQYLSQLRTLLEELFAE
ncbi:MAG: NAD(P)-dependent oxidoreductase [Nitrospinota bacterium]|nr:MAG: NAD(P)-dependent oxidoreductase [Nitrospinota bacterium]